MKILFVLSIAFVSTFSIAADTVTVVCFGRIQGISETVRLKLHAKKMEIVQWDDTKWGVSAGSYLGVYSQPIEEYGFEWTKSFRARNGYSILELGTTADSHTIGVNLQEKKGFYTYKDQGSGAGHLGPIVLNCRSL
jgi:hypothetical protein